MDATRDRSIRMNLPARMSDATIRGARRADAAAICAIYNHYIQTSYATFEESPVAVDEMAHRIEGTLAAWPWLVAEVDGNVGGYAYASQWKPRTAYRHTAESTIYLAPGYTRCGLGSSLYTALLEALRVIGTHSVVACVALPNAESIALHEKFDFRKVAHFHDGGIKFGRWIDVAYWQRLV